MTHEQWLAWVERFPHPGHEAIMVEARLWRPPAPDPTRLERLQERLRQHALDIAERMPDTPEG